MYSRSDHSSYIDFSWIDLRGCIVINVNGAVIVEYAMLAHVVNPFQVQN